VGLRKRQIPRRESLQKNSIRNRGAKKKVSRGVEESRRRRVEFERGKANQFFRGNPLFQRFRWDNTTMYGRGRSDYPTKSKAHKILKKPRSKLKRSPWPKQKASTGTRGRLSGSLQEVNASGRENTKKGVRVKRPEKGVGDKKGGNWARE